MVNRKIAAICLGTVSLVGGALALSYSLLQGPSEGPDLQDLLGTPKTAMRMQLYSAPKDAKDKSANGLHEGFDYYSADGKTKINSRLIYQDGASEDVFYRADESKEWSRDYYPLASGEDRAILRSIARFAEDGKTYVSHDVMRKDGKFERRGKLLPDGNYELTFYCQDGKTPEKVQLFGKTKYFMSETAIFCENGKPIRSVEDGQYGSKILILYRKDGSIASKQEMNSSEHGVYYNGEAFDEKGNVILIFNYGGWSKQVRQGDMEWTEATMGSANEFARYYDKDGKIKRFSQHFKLKVDYQPDKGKIFTGTTEYDAAGKITREIDMSEDGSRPVRITVRTDDPSKKIIHTLDDSGMIAKTVLQETVDGAKKETPQALPAQRDPKLAAELFKMLERPAFPEWDDGHTSTSSKVYDFH